MTMPQVAAAVIVVTVMAVLMIVTRRDVDR